MCSEPQSCFKHSTSKLKQKGFRVWGLGLCVLMSNYTYTAQPFRSHLLKPLKHAPRTRNPKHLYLEAEYPSPKKVSLFNYGRFM